MIGARGIPAVALLFGMVLAMPETAGAQRGDSDDEDATRGGSIHMKAAATKDDGRKEGEYGGVDPDRRAENISDAAARRACRRRSNAITWIGFQTLDDGKSRVFVQMCKDVPYRQQVVQGELEVFLPGMRIATRNAARALDTSFFDTALSAVRPHPRSGRRKKGTPASEAGVALRFAFKNAADVHEAEATIQRLADGYTYLYLQFRPHSGPRDDAQADVDFDDDNGGNKE